MIVRVTVSLLAAGAALVGPAPVAVAAPANVQMPFGCGQTWYASTYAGHSPSEYSVDWNLPGEDAGQPVLAGVSGTATVMPEQPGSYGKWVQVDAGGGWTFRYGHLSSVTVTNGPVTAQTEIGRVGHTGQATGDHLHYEQRLNGVVQPATFNGAAISYRYSLPGNPYQSANCASGTTQSKRLGGDFDADGKEDIALVTPRGGTGVNVTVLRSTGTSFAYAGLWYYDTGVAFTSSQLVVGRFTPDARADLALVTPRGGSGVNVTVLRSTGTSFAYAGLWYYDDSTPFGNFQIHVGNFNASPADGRDDIAIVTARGAAGVNVVPMLSTGSAFAYGGQWYSDPVLTFGGFRFAAGDVNGDGRDDLVQVTPRGATGINVVPMLSDGSAAFAYGGLWYFDTGTPWTGFGLYSGRFNTDARADLAIVTPRGATGVNLVPLLSTGTSFGYGGLWLSDDSLTMGGYQFVVANVDGTSGQDVVVVTPRGSVGINIVPRLSNGTGAFTYAGLWYYDTTVVF